MLEELWKKPSRVYVLSGPSGVGKDSVLDKSLELPKMPQHVVRCLTATSRPMRPGERDRIDYIFMDESNFLLRRDEGHFVETAFFAGNWYGTPFHTLEDACKDRKCPILKIEVQGAIQIRQRFPDAIMVFIAPPSMEQLRIRLTSRGNESHEDVDRRLLIAEREIQEARNYDYVIVNQDLDVAADDFASIVRCEEQLRIVRQPDSPC